MGPPSAISAIELAKTFGGTVRALDNLSLEVPAGSVLGLLGPNGAGKTTAVRILTTILQPDSGSARILNYDVVRDADTVRRNIGLAGQYATVDEYLSARENLWMVGRLNRLAKKVVRRRTDELLEGFGLTEAADRPLKTYSGGMRRRIDLAAALVSEPPVLFLDEPTTGLDPHSRQDLWRVIEELVSGGTTVLLTTQYLEEADRLAHRIAVVDHGTVIAEGTAADLKATLGETVIEVTVKDPHQAAEAAQLLESVGSRQPSVEGHTIELPVDEGARTAPAALRTLDQHGVAITGLVLREPSLDDVFLSLTGHRAEEPTGDGEPAGTQDRGDQERVTAVASDGARAEAEEHSGTQGAPR